MSELKPCPFCGGLAGGGETEDHGRFIACVKCGASTNVRYACGDEPWPLLIAQWNCRASTDPTPSAEPVAGQRDGALTDDEIDSLWTHRLEIHNGELMPQLRDFARAILTAGTAR